MMKHRIAMIGVMLFGTMVSPALAQNAANDPGVRGGPPGAGGPLAGLSVLQKVLFDFVTGEFAQVHSVTGNIPGESGNGLGPTFNLNGCGGCHAFPALGGSSPPLNPQIAAASLDGARNTIPEFLSLQGPVREARFVRNADGSPDGAVHDLFTIRGRVDADGCEIRQPDFESELARSNVALRIPTPLFGGGLIDNIADETIVANKNANRALKAALGISGRENRNSNDGTITRFGWKAQNKSLLLFSGEAYNVEMGVTNELFPNERNLTPRCTFNHTPEDHLVFEDAADSGGGSSGLQNFATFMRLLAPPTPASETPAVTRGKNLFSAIGCALCHTPTMMTAASDLDGLEQKPANLYSDLLLHNMGAGLADGIRQGLAGPDEFRTAPLWGLGQRLFFLHDGRASDLLTAIRAHRSQNSEANRVIAYFEALSERQVQELLNFLRSL